VEILFARDWKLGDADKPETQTPYRTTWASGWWIDHVTKLFEGDISPHTDRSLALHTVPSVADPDPNPHLPTANPQPQTPNPKPQTSNPNPQPPTSNPQPRPQPQPQP